ncbi:L-fucose-proton symporter [Muribaculaceae bacterium]|nr:L-fucose-proton symporter [Muribaculaceae bacterium]
MSTQTRKPNYTLPIVVMFFLFAMISFVTGFQNPFGVILKAQLGLSNFQSQLGAAANFIAYAIMGIPAGILLQRKGYKFSAISAVLVGLVGVVIMFLSSLVEGQQLIFTIYLIGALVAGFSMCMLNTVVNPMLNTLGGGGKTGNQLIQFGGTLNSLAATICPIFVGILIGNVSKETSLIDAQPALYVAGGVFLLAFVVLALAKLPEPILDEIKANKAAGKAAAAAPSLGGALGFRHFVLGAIAIFLYIGIEIGIPQIANVYMTAQTTEQAQETIRLYEAQNTVAETVDPMAAVVAEELATAEAEETATEALNHEEEGFIAASTEMADPSAAGIAEATAQEESAKCTGNDCCDKKVITVDEYEAAQAIVNGDIKPGLGIGAAIAGALVGMYWFMMLIGRLVGGVVGGKISSRAMLTGVASLSLILILAGIFADPATTVSAPGFSSDGGSLSFGMFEVPINILFFVLCGLCTSVMWGGIFNLAVEGLGKYTAVASGFFMVMVCGGGIILPIQAGIADSFGYLSSYWVLVACAAYLLFYALIGSKVSKRDDSAA